MRLLLDTHVWLWILTTPERLNTSVRELGIGVLPIALGHALAAAGLPPLHKDPFDRMLVAQAQAEGLTLVTADEAVQAYGGAVLWAI